MRVRLLALCASLAFAGACTHYDLSTSVASPPTVSAVAERGGALLYFTPVEGASAYDVYVARVSSLTPRNAESLPGGFHFMTYSSPVPVELVDDGQPSYLIVVARAGDETSDPTPPVAVTPRPADAPLVLGTPMWDETATDAGDQFGRTLEAGDYNADGYADIVVGSPYDDQGSLDGGKFEVFLGRATGLPPIRDHYETGLSAGSLYSSALATGDFNCDGVDDLAVGAPNRFPGARGAVDYYAGTALGIDFVRALHPVAVSATNIGFGTALAAGDTDGDGCDDLLVGENGPAGYAPLVHLFAGSADGLVDMPAESRPAEGSSTVTRWGAALAIADLDGDGYGEAIVGEPLFGASRGRLSIFGGPTTIGSAPLLLQTGPADGARTGSFLASGGDTDGDGYDELLIGDQPLSGPATLRVALGGPPVLELTLSVEITGFQNPPNAPLFALAADVDQDGYDDLITGDLEVDTLTSGSGGEVAVRRGGPDGLSDAPDWILEAEPTSIAFGAALAAGDFDGNGTVDIGVGAPGATNARGAAGVYGGVPTRGPRVDAGRAKYLGQPGYIDFSDAWFFDAGPGPHTCVWSIGDDFEHPIENCTPARLAEDQYWQDSGDLVVRLRVTAADERYGESVTHLHAEFP